MIELRPEFKPFFYVSSICLGAEIAFLFAFFVSPRSGWFTYAAILVLAASVPLLAGAAIAAMVGYMGPLRQLLGIGLLLFIAWLALLFMSSSVVAGFIFLFVAVISYKILQYHYRDRAVDAIDSGAE